jgi:hypothetical protein
LASERWRWLPLATISPSRPSLSDDMQREAMAWPADLSEPEGQR